MVTRGVRSGPVLAALVLALSAWLVSCPARADDAVLDIILNEALPIIDKDLATAKDLLKCAIKHNGLNATTLQICGGGLAKDKANAYLQGDSTAQTAVTVTLAATKKHWATVVEVGGTELIVKLACTVVMPPGPPKSFLCSGVSAQVAKLAKPVVKSAVDALSSSPPNWAKLLTLVGPTLACGLIPEPTHSALCSPIMQVLEKGIEAGKDVAEFAAKGVTDAVGAALEGFGDLVNPSDPKPTPKKFFQLYYAYYYHKGAWVKLVQGDAAFSQLVAKNHSTCVSYYGHNPCDVMRNTYVADVTATVNNLKAAAPLYFETRIQPDDRFVLELQWAAWQSIGWGPGQCASDLGGLFPLPEGLDQDARPRPTVWHKACEPVRPLILAWLKAREVYFAVELASFKNQACTLLKYNAHLQCGSYPGQTACRKRAGRWSDRCEMNYGKADAAVAAGFVKQLGKRCAAHATLDTTIECTRPWKQEQCAGLVNGTPVPNYWGKAQVKCQLKADPDFEQGKVAAQKLVYILNGVKPSEGNAMMVTAIVTDPAAGCRTTWDPLAITCKDPEAVAKLASNPNVPGAPLKACPPDPNKDGADVPCYGGPYSFKAAQETLAGSGHLVQPPSGGFGRGPSDTSSTTPQQSGVPGPPAPSKATGPVMPYGGQAPGPAAGPASGSGGSTPTRGAPSPGGLPGAAGPSVAGGAPSSGSWRMAAIRPVAPDVTVTPQLQVGSRAGAWGGTVIVDAAQGRPVSGGLCEFSVRHTVQNQGTAPAGGFAGIWQNGTVPGSWAHAYPPLKEGATSPQTDTLPLRPGANPLTLRLDPQNQIRGEASEQNTFQVTVHVTGACTTLVLPPGGLRSAPGPPPAPGGGPRLPAR